MKQSPVIRNNVTVSGNPLGNAIVFGHGFGTDQTSWNAIIPEFEQAYKIIRYDNVGGGKADINAFSPNKYDNLETYADDLIGILDELRVNQVIMVGHSVSGMISLLAAIKRPDFFDKLILIGASPR